MLLYLYLSVLVTASASILKVDYSNIVQGIKPSQTNSENHPQKLRPFIKSSERLQSVYNLKQDLKVESVQCLIVKTVADCSKRAITNINQIKVPFNITGLNLAFNNIQDLSNSLANFTKLEWLDISHNHLQNLNNDNFCGLSALTMLHINSNSLTMSPGAFPADVFKPLLNLQQLWMHNNSHVEDPEQLDYPDTSLAELRNLKELCMDGLPNKIFGFGFSNMTSLKNLTLNGRGEGYCSLRTLPSNMFTNLAGLQSLSLILCNISGTGLDPDVFLPLKKLTYLDLTGNDDVNFDNLGAALIKLKDSEIKTLNISNIINPYSPGVFVSSNFSKSLPRNLTELVASSNAIEVLETGVLDNLPESLRVLDVGSNKFAFLDYLKDLNKMNSLETLILSGGEIFILPYYYPPNAYVPPSIFRDFYGDNAYIEQSLPPNLTDLRITNAGWSNFLTEFHFNKSNRLEFLNLDYNNFPVLQGPITGLNSLKNLSLYGCRIRKIHPIFFQNFTSLLFLNLSTNYFGKTALKKDESIFSYLSNLQVLDLSFIDIRNISYHTFEALSNLERLFLQLNPIDEFHVNISNMKNLKYINLSMTNLVILNSEMTGMLDNIKLRSSEFKIDLSKNTFDCFCSNLDFVRWMTTTKVITNTTQITCSFVDGSRRDMSLPELSKIYNSLKRQCASYFQLYSVVISATILLLILIAGATVYNFRLKLQYLYYSAILYYRSRKKNYTDESYDYDVFVSYAHEDHEFVTNTLYPKLQSNGLKIHIHGLHFTAGEFISSNIVNAVHSSKHTLVVLTQHHLNSKWSKFEVEMANMEQVQTGRPVLLFLIKEEIPKLSTQLMFHIKQSTYIKFPQTQSNLNEMKIFWSKLVSDLKS